MILIGLGSNLPGRHGGPRDTLVTAVKTLEGHGAKIVKLSSWYVSSPVPSSDQADFVNGVASIEIDGEAGDILERLHGIEDMFDRRRTVPNAARTLDLDLLDYQSMIKSDWPVLPHPRLHERLFVLRPLADIEPTWRHPRTGMSIDQMIAAIPPGQKIARVTI